MKTDDSWSAKASRWKHEKQMSRTKLTPRITPRVGPGGNYPVRTVAEVMAEIRRENAFFGRR